MSHAIAWIFEKLLRLLLQLLLPPSGRHRAADTADGRPAVQHRHTPTTLRPARVPDAPARPMVAERVIASTVRFRPLSGAPDGHGATLVRPYVVAHEQQRWLERAERRLRRQRRRALWLAAHGVDVGPRLIHGVKVAA